ncbi:MAG: glycosyltransferase family 4 protein [Candidatus Omnitrophica bacterium]|nr:glycosyltransferase family 4 protein [Candidatus Omnitrophota bacterium]
MKIVRIIARLNIGGPARNAVLLAEGLSGYPHGNAWETVLVCGEVSESEGDMMYLAGEKGIRPVIVPELGRELSFWDDWKAFWKIYGIIRREKPDIVHTHTAKAGALGRLAGEVYRLLRPFRPRNDRVIILVHTFHGHVLYGYFGRIKSWVFLWIEKILSLFTDRIVTVSEGLKRELVEKYRIAPEKKFSVVELGFELDELLRLLPKTESGSVNIGIIGRLVGVKNHRMLLRVVKHISEIASAAAPRSKSLIWNGAAQPRNDNGVKFTIIGDGELRRELEDYAKELGIEDIVEFRGWVKDVAEIYRDLDIIVLTSLNEGTPVSIIEAMASARPVAATDVGGVRDVVEDGKSGYLVKSGDEEKFAKNLVDLIRDPEKRKRFGQYGRESVKNRFSKDRLIKDAEELYNKLLNNK